MLCRYWIRVVSLGAIALEIPCTAMPAVLPSLRPWSHRAHPRCEYDAILSHWTANDAVTFLVDLGGYRPALHDLLTNDEREQVHRFKTAIARRRFVMSRAILKHILSEILPHEKITDIILVRNPDGRILVRDRPHVYICLSYSGTTIAITLGKRKIGSDIEGVRPIRSKKITASPAFRTYSRAQGTEHVQQVIHMWTLVESYAKLYDTNPYPLLNRRSPFKDADFVSYLIDQHTIFSLASTQGGFTEVLAWLEIERPEKTRPIQ